MSSVYDVGPTEGTEWCNPVNKADFKRFVAEINGTPRRTTWTPIAMKLLRKTLRKRFKQSDSPWFGSDALIFRQSAIEKMKPILDIHGELLPLVCAEAELWVFNATFVLDALDDQASEGSRFDDGRFMSIDKHVFYPDVVVGVDMFKLVNRRVSPTFVSDRFVDLWNASGLRGLVFKKLWSSE